MEMHWEETAEARCGTISFRTTCEYDLKSGTASWSCLEDNCKRTLYNLQQYKRMIN